LPANRAFQNRNSGCSTRSFFWFGQRSTTNRRNGKIRTVPGLQKQLQTALILSVTFIWSYPWVCLNGVWYSLRYLSPDYMMCNEREADVRRNERFK
jgi:hypothetical protein